ncbi:MAG: hypothetical protein GWN84_07330, partial [Gammaproteobacteria bacterium]|nr:hypothetical protein [Gammaproteobacteria bacterium]NIU03847.1 hypothetical protein [Gammaproteobacteria bacterium]NIV51181.1 hypothetical protein [Gammaproteobacteria bacterium]NIX85121.1 hypothetical protein [Gammaproteobacteria bacterium]
ASDVCNARRDLAEAHRLWESVDKKDDVIEAEILFYQASYDVYQDNLGTSRELLDRAIGLCEGKPRCRLLAQCLIQRATVLGYIGDPADALPDLALALEVLAHQAEPRLKLLVHTSLAIFRALAGRFDEAEKSLAEGLERNAELGDRVLYQHLRWAQGLVHHGRGQLDPAAAAYEKAMGGFAAVGQPGYVAMAALELALVRDEQGRFEESTELAATAIPVLEHFQHVSGVTAALRMLNEALAAQEVPRKVLDKVRQSLHALWRDPTADLAAVKARSGAG